MRKASLLVLVCSTAVAGCAQWKSNPRVSPSTAAVYPGAIGKIPARRNAAAPEDSCQLTGGFSDSKRGAINLDCFRFPEQGKTGKTAYAQASYPPGSQVAKPSAASYPVNGSTKNPTMFERQRVKPEEKEQLVGEATVARNRLAAILIKTSDDVCVLEKGRLVSTEASINIILTFLTQTLSGIGSVVQGATASNILSAGAALSSGTQTNINANYYKNQIIYALNKVIDQERDSSVQAIDAKRPLDVTEYSVDEMIRDVNKYHQSCSFERGLQKLLDAAADKSGAQAALQARGRDAALVKLRQEIETIDARLAQADKLKLGADEIESLQKARKSLQERMVGLFAADADKLVGSANAGDLQATGKPTAAGTDAREKEVSAQAESEK